MEITKREVIASIVIIALMLILGFTISEKIANSQNDKNSEYQKAIHIDDPELFQYGMDTSVGNAFVYGSLEAVEPVSFEEVEGEYIWIKKTEEHYNRHTRKVKKNRKKSNGKTETYTDTEVYYSWDYYDSWEKECSKIKFCGVEFDLGKISLPSTTHIDTQSQGLSDIRYVYRGITSGQKGTIYTRLKNGTISDNTTFLANQTPEAALEDYTSGGAVVQVLFWAFWILFIAIIVLLFYYFENKWLE